MHDNLASLRRRVCLLCCLVAVSLLAGCGDREPERRQRFISMLEEKVLAAAGGKLLPLPREEAVAIGKYADQYQILVSFHEDMRTAFNSRFATIMRLISVDALREAVDKRSALAEALRNAARLRQEIAENLRERDAAKATLQQADDLKTVYDKAYDKAVTRQAGAFSTALTAMEETLRAILELADFVKANEDGLTIAGQQIQVKQGELRVPLEEKIQTVEAAVWKLLAANQDLRDMAQ